MTVVSIGARQCLYCCKGSAADSGDTFLWVVIAGQRTVSRSMDALHLRGASGREDKGKC